MKKLIKESGMTIRQFSEHYEIPYNTVRQWYNGTRQAPSWIRGLIEKAASGIQLKFEENEYELYEFFNEEGLKYRAHRTGEEENEEYLKKRLDEWNRKEFKKMRVSKVRMIAEYKI